MNYIKDVYPNIKNMKKYARKEWGNKVKCIQLNLKGYKVSDFDDPTTDIYPFIELTLSDEYNDGLVEKESYSTGERSPYLDGKKPSWQPTSEDQVADDWYIVN